MKENSQECDKQIKLPAELFKFLEEDVSMHKKLLAIIGREREYLFNSSIDDLFPLSHAKEDQLAKINDLEKRLKDYVKSIFQADSDWSEGITFSQLIELSYAQQKRVLKSYLTILRALKDEIQQSNSHNKKYIEERLTLIREAMSLFLPSSKAPFYTARGWRNQCTCMLRKEV